MRRIIIATEQSIWTGQEHTDGSVTITGRDTNEFHPVTRERAFAGPITSDEGRAIVGKRFVMDNEEAPYGTVYSGVVVRIMYPDALPAKAPEGEVDGVRYIVLSPSWHWLTPFVGSTTALPDFRKCFDVADLLATLKDMGLVTDADIRAARERRG